MYISSTLVRFKQTFIKLSFFQTMSAFNNTDYSALSIYGPPIEQGKQGEFYVLNGVKYFRCFPMDWALAHNVDEKTAKCGPEFCEDCQAQGFYRGVFVGYCGSCSAAYDVPRGRAGFPPSDGFWYYYKICKPEDLEQFHLSYMKGVPISEIGDEDENEEEPRYLAQEEEEEEEQEQEPDYYNLQYPNGYEPNNDDYYSQWDDAEQDYEDRRLDYELSRVPRDMRDALDPRISERIADFRAAAREESRRR
jgi:hypothetical protein